MKWPHRHREAEPPTRGEAEARKALHKADDQVHRAEARNPEVTRVVHTLKQYRERNNFTELVRRTLQGTGH